MPGWKRTATRPARCCTSASTGPRWNASRASSTSGCPWRTETPLTEPPYRDKEQWFAEARRVGLKTPRLYDLGFAHNNCGGACVKGGQAQWVRLLDVFPERFAKVEAFEQKMRTRLGKDVSILRDRTGGTTTPLTLAALRARVEAEPDQLDLFDEGGCGCFTDSPAA